MESELNKQRITHLSSLLLQAERPVRMLRLVAWRHEVKQEFFANKCQLLPKPEYEPFDPKPSLEFVKQVRRQLGRDPVDKWFAKIASGIEAGCHMLAARGQKEFFEHSSYLYGTPRTKLPDGFSDSLGLASLLSKSLEQLANVDLGAPAASCMLAETMRDQIAAACHHMFGDEAPKVEIVQYLSANAIAGPKTIRIRHGASFSDKDLLQLINHEAYIHVATFLNGMKQTDVPILSTNHPATTRTQEGLAVFAEFITGSMELGRLQRLADRVTAVQMAIDGADFIQVFRTFVERTGNADQSFEDTRRVFRGGVVSGGAPYTKDIVYLDGLLRVHNFLRVVVSAGRSDCLRMLFCGKLDIEDIPVLCYLAEAGLCKPPKYLPPWAADLRFLVSYLAYSSFLNQVDLNKIKAHYAAILDSAPRVKFDHLGAAS